MVISVDDAQRQFAFVKGNRPVNVRAVKQKEKSMKAYGQLTPITVTDGERVIQMGGRLVDLKGNEIPDGDAGKYYAVLDGQHRLVAYQNLGLDLNDLVICEPLNAELSITEIIAQMNICTTVWKKSACSCTARLVPSPRSRYGASARNPCKQKTWWSVSIRRNCPKSLRIKHGFVPA